MSGAVGLGAGLLRDGGLELLEGEGAPVRAGCLPADLVMVMVAWVVRGRVLTSVE